MMCLVTKIKRKKKWLISLTQIRKYAKCNLTYELRVKCGILHLTNFLWRFQTKHTNSISQKNADFPIRGQKVVQKQKAAAESGRCFQFTSSAELRLFMEASRAAFLDSVASSLRCKSSSSDSKQLAFDFHCDSSLSTVACKFLSKFSCNGSNIVKALEGFFKIHLLGHPNLKLFYA